MRDLTAKETAGRLRAALTAGSLNWEKLAVFAEWQKYNSCTDMCQVCEHTDESRAAFDGPANRYPAPCPSREALMDEIADCIQSCANLAAMVGVSDLTPYMESCEGRNRERGRYGD